MTRIITDPAAGPVWHRWAWFVGLWAASAATTAALAYALRAVIIRS